MIFVTVGTHEQQFNRLLEEIDRLKEDGVIKDEVFIQSGFSTYEPKHCQYEKLISYKKMCEMYEQADIIITHGGPASFMKALEYKKTPIVVPRQAKFDEHVNDHQVEFVKIVEERFHNIIGVYDISNLQKELLQMNDYKFGSVTSNNDKFNEQFQALLSK